MNCKISTYVLPHHGPVRRLFELQWTCTSTIIGVVLLVIVATNANGQQRSVSGKVTNEYDQGIPGVNIIIQGTSTGTASDAMGHYSIPLPSNDKVVLVFSAIGYVRKEVEVGARTAIDIQLVPDITQLNEIVVTGYSTMQKKDLSSSIAVVDVKDMQQYASSNFGEQLQGKLPGVQVTTTSDPGSSQSIRIRGIGSVNNNEALYVIDGVPIQNEANTNFLNPNDIESIALLKDASSSSIYGARAANGVIVVTTKQGKGAPAITLDFYRGTQVIGKTPDIATPDEVLEIEKGLAAGAGKVFTSSFYVKDINGNWVLPDYSVYSKGYRADDPLIDPSEYFLNTAPTGDYSQNYPIVKVSKEGTDWFNEMFRPASIANLQMGVSGGSEKGSYYLSMNYFDHEGIMIRNAYRRLQTRVNGSYHLRNNIRIGENFNIAYQEYKGALGSGTVGSVSYDQNSIAALYNAPRTNPVYDINGYWANNNPVAIQNRIADGARNYTWRYTGSVFGEIDLLKNLTFKSNFGLDHYSGPDERYLYSRPENEQHFPNSLRLSWFNNQSWVWSNTLSARKSFGNHSLSALLGAEIRSAFEEGSTASGSRLAYGDDPNYRVLSNTDPSTYNLSSFKSESKMRSFFASINYDFKDKYFLTATVRRDGSSLFINNKYGTFPAASAAWRISNEDFMRSINAINNFKLRASYGATGNNEVLGGNYPGFTSYATTVQGSSYDINGTGNSVVAGFGRASVGNPDLKWETSIMTDIGIDATLWNNLEVTFDWFHRKTKDMIYPVQLPLQAGDFFQNQNIGAMVNHGYELQVGYQGNTVRHELKYGVTLSGTHYDNKVLALDAYDSTHIDRGTAGILGAVTRTQAGYPISQFWGFIDEGLWESQEEINATLFSSPGNAKPGRMKFRDLNGDGKINDDDKTFIGSPIPKLLLGLTVTLSYRNFDFTVFVNGVYGTKIFNTLHFADFNSDFTQYPSKAMLYEAGKTLPVLDASDNYSYQASAHYVEDASYTRLRNLVIGYNIPRSVLSKIGLRSARIYIQGQNLFTWTTYSGLDPEGSISFVSQGNQQQRDYVTGVDNYDFGRYPPARQFIVGINLGF